MHVDNLCRICLTDDIITSTMQPLFEEDETCTDIVQRVEVCGGIVLKQHEEFPKMICAQCLDKLNVSYEFRLMCQASEHTLLDNLFKSEIKEECQDNEISKAGKDNDDGMSFDIDTEYIDEQEVHFEDVTDKIEEEVIESDMEPNVESAEEFIEYSDSDGFAEDFQNTVKRQSKSSKLNKIKPTKTTTNATSTSDNSVRKRVRSKVNQSDIKTEINCEQKSKRGRKKKGESQPERIICEICGNIYATRSILSIHLRRHIAEKPLECEICHKKFACSSNISRHMRTHTGERPYACKYCGRTFTDQSTHIKHERIHTNERPFKCQTCGRSFTYSNVLKNHILTHTGEKPFACVPCDKTFPRKHLLDQHIATITHQQKVSGGCQSPKKIVIKRRQINI